MYQKTPEHAHMMPRISPEICKEMLKDCIPGQTILRLKNKNNPVPRLCIFLRIGINCVVVKISGKHLAEFDFVILEECKVVPVEDLLEQVNAFFQI